MRRKREPDLGAPSRGLAWHDVAAIGANAEGGLWLLLRRAWKRRARHKPLRLMEKSAGVLGGPFGETHQASVPQSNVRVQIGFRPQDDDKPSG
ncbi:MAG: hypothetical protein JWP14_548 [Frankiales bacterium]|nr:hypothetical protein [Frankiales bacterium]